MKVIYTYEYKTRDTLEFPDVTICNVNPFMRSKACANGSLLFEAKRFKKEGEELVILPFCRDNTTYVIGSINFMNTSYYYHHAAFDAGNGCARDSVERTKL